MGAFFSLLGEKIRNWVLPSWLYTCSSGGTRQFCLWLTLGILTSITCLISPSLTRYCVALSLMWDFNRPTNRHLGRYGIWLGPHPHLCFDKRRGNSEVMMWAHGMLNNCIWDLMRSHCFVFLTMCSAIAELAHHLSVTTCAQTCWYDGTLTGGWTLPAGWSQWDELSPLGGGSHVSIMAWSEKLHHLSIRNKITLPSTFCSRKPMIQSYSS